MRRTIGFVLMLMAVAGQARADFTKGSQTVAIFGGAGGSSSQYDFNGPDKDKVTGGGGSFGAQYLYYVMDTPSLAFGIDVLSSQNGDRTSDDLIANVDTTARLKSFVGMAIMRLTYPRGTFRPYIFGGLGVHDSEMTLTGTPKPGATWSNGGTEHRVLVDQDGSSVAVGYGIGMDAFLSEAVFLGLELRGAWLAGIKTDETVRANLNGIQSDNEHDVSQGNILLRLGFKF